MITVRFFAAIRELTDIEILTIDQHFETVNDLFSWLQQIYPSLAKQSNICFAVDHQFVSPDSHLPQQCEVALFPPVTGG